MSGLLPGVRIFSGKPSSYKKCNLRVELPEQFMVLCRLVH